MIGRNYEIKQEGPRIESKASCVVIQRDSSKLAVDKGIKNCWKWEWLEQLVDGNPVGQFIRKIDS